MIQINKEKREVTIHFNKHFYSIEALKETINDFKDVCAVEISNKKSIKVLLKPKTAEHELEEIGYEFCNYALGIEKQKQELR